MATSDILSYLLILASYLGAFYVFRVSEAEHLSSLSETVRDYDYYQHNNNINNFVPCITVIHVIYTACMQVLISYNFVSNKKKRTGPVSILL